MRKSAGRALLYAAVAAMAINAPMAIRGEDERSSRSIIPTAKITPDSVTFPDTRVGKTSQVQTLTVTKTGSLLPLYIFSVRLADSLNFRITSDGCSGAVLGEGDSCEIKVDFTPGQKGHFSNTLSVINLGKNVITTAPLDGRGTLPAVTLSSNNLDFGHQTVGTSSTPQTVTLTNSGRAVLNISDITAGGGFAAATACGATVVPGGSCDIDVTFTPSSAGDKTGTVTITDDASDSPQIIALSGTGIAPGSPDASLSATGIDFGNQAVGSTSDARQVVLTNVGTAVLNINSITAGGAFSASNDCGATLNPGQACTINVTFSPSSPSAYSGTLAVSDNATDSPQTVELLGRGIVPHTPYAVLSTTVVDFGEQVIGTPSEPVSVTLKNVGTSDLEAEKSTIEDDRFNSFSRLDRCAGESLPYNGTCVIDLTFTPLTHGELSATLEVNNDASDSPQTVTLVGTGIYPRGLHFSTQAEVSPGDMLVVQWGITDVDDYVTAYFGAITPRGELYTVDTRRDWENRVVPVAGWFNPGGDRSGTLYVTVPADAPPGEYILGAALSNNGRLIEPGFVFHALTVR